MGGIGSGSQPDWKPKPGRRKRQAVAVSGTGEPMKPDGLSAEGSKVWQSLVEALKGTAFMQDSIAMEAAVSLVVRHRAMNRELDKDPTNVQLNRISLAVGRQLAAVLAKFGMTPRDRQVLLVPKADDDEPGKDAGKSRFFKKGVKNGK